MTKKFSSGLLVLRQALFGALLGILIVAGQAAQAGNIVDVLERPVVPSARAFQATMLAVARAGKRLVAVGERGIVLLSDDDGRNWHQIRMPVSTTLTQVVFVDAKRGWVAGHSGIVLTTSDSGETWVKQLDGAKAAQLELDSAKVSGNPKRNTYAERLVKDGADKPILGMYFADVNNGFVVGAYGLALATADGGKTWQSMMGDIDNPKGCHLYAVVPAGQALYIVGEQGLIYRSSDAGHSFTALQSNSHGTFFGLAATPGGELVAFGLRGNVFRSVDEGRHWERVDMPPVTLTAGLRLADGSIALTDEGGHLLLSRDAGRSFQTVALTRPSIAVGLAQASDGALVIAGPANMTRIDPSVLKSVETNK